MAHVRFTPIARTEGTCGSLKSYIKDVLLVEQTSLFGVETLTEIVALPVQFVNAIVSYILLRHDLLLI